MRFGKSRQTAFASSRKNMVLGTTKVTELCCFLRICFLLFFLMKCAGCLYNVVQMTVESGKAVAAVDA